MEDTIYMDTIYILLILIAAYLAYNFLANRGIRQISTNDLKQLLSEKSNSKMYVDVRTKGEFGGRSIKGFKNIPLDQLGNRLSQLPKDKTLVLICQSGSRSSMAARKLKKAGYTDIINVRGGMNMWR